MTCADCWRNIASLTMSAVSSTFRAHLSEHSEKSAISLSLMVLPFPNPGSLVISQVGNSVRPMHLFGRQRRVQVPISSGVVSKDSLTFSGQNQFQMASIEMTFHGEVSDTALSGTADMTSRSMILGPAMETATLSLIKQ